MKLLLDTHAFIWFAADTSRLSKTAFNALMDVANERWVSDASIWEMAIKVQLGKLKFPEPFEEKVLEALRRAQCNVLAIATKHVARVSKLPSHHRDPFDRLLVVQTEMESCQIVTHDPVFGQYGIPICW